MALYKHNHLLMWKESLTTVRRYSSGNVNVPANLVKSTNAVKQGYLNNKFPERCVLVAGLVDGCKWWVW